MYSIIYTDLINDNTLVLKELNYYNTKNMIKIITQLEKEDLPKFNYHEITTLMLSKEDIDFIRILIIKH